MTGKDAFTSTEWQTLQFAPLWVFSAVAGADRTIDQKEVEALSTEIMDAPRFKEPLVREVLMSVAIDLVNIMEAYKRDTRDLMSGLRDVGNLLDRKVPKQQGEAFKRAMIFIGSNVAKASGGGILQRDPVSTEEKTALVMAAMALGITP